MTSIFQFTQLFLFFAARLGWGAAEEGVQGLCWCNTLKFLDFRMLIGKIITTISHNF
jgi:hypothetical protein